MKETELYPAIKTLFEGQGYEVKSEVHGCDVMAMRGDEPPVVVELKTTLSLPLVLQAVERLSVADNVYVAFPLPAGRAPALWRNRRRAIVKLCRRLGIGLITISRPGSRAEAVEVHLDPGPYAPRRDGRRAGMLMKEFRARVGDPNEGGCTRTPLVTAYRQDALRCLRFLEGSGPARLADVRNATEVERAAAILQRDVYGWFMRVERGVYAATPRGSGALAEFKDAVRAL